MTNPSLLILAGDGIGPEIIVETRKIIDWFAANKGLTFDIHEDAIGGAAYDKYGSPCDDSTMAKAQKVDAVLLGAVGGPKYDDLDFSLKPERGLLRLRKEMDLYANLRPAQCFDALKDFSSLKPDLDRWARHHDRARIDLGGLFRRTKGYHGRGQGPRGRQHPAIHHGRDPACGAVLHLNWRGVAATGWCSVEKANVMESGILVARRDPS